MSRKSTIMAGGAVVALALGLLAILGLRPARAASPDDLKGKAAPEIALKAVDGKDVKLSQYKGKVVLLDFWATWCAPCKKSLPHLQQLSDDKEKAKEGFVVLAINAGETADKVAPFLTANNYTFTVALDSDNKAQDAYLLEGVPTTIVVGRDGTVRAVFTGLDPTGEHIDAAVQAALKDK